MELLTEPSRLWAVRDTLPLFWRVRKARSIGYEFLRADGRVMEVLLDADAHSGLAGC